ncbi:MAG TPA: RICIN domain-containing protein [Bryobacteraceae bacterium]|nr:RICIN domain-containing protein [Bryobacteraceae bacterium]
MKRTLILVMASAALLAQGGFRGPGRYEIYSPLSKKVLDMDSNDQRTIIQYEARRTDNQFWDVTDAGGGYFYIRNARNGNALAASSDRNSTPLAAEPFNSGPQQQWRLESGQDSTAILVNRNGKAIDIPYGSTNNGTKINTYNKNNEINQRWQFQQVSGNAGSRYNNDRYDRNDRNNRGNGSFGRNGQSNNRYDSPNNNSTTPPSGQRDADGVYYDDRERIYKMDGDGVCFYRDRNFQGEAVCATTRNGRRRWNSNITDIGSVKFFGRATGVQVFDREDFRGNSVEITGDERNFNRASRGLRGNPQSLRVY